MKKRVVHFNRSRRRIGARASTRRESFPDDWESRRQYQVGALQNLRENVRVVKNLSCMGSGPFILSTICGLHRFSYRASPYLDVAPVIGVFEH